MNQETTEPVREMCDLEKLVLEYILDMIIPDRDRGT